MNAAELQLFKIELAGTAEVMGRDFSPLAIRMFSDHVAEFPFADAIQALQDARSSLNRMPTVADIIQRLESRDGRPGVEEAWALIPLDERSSVVWTPEMATAYGLAAALMQSDPIAARMAFKEKYLAEVRVSREQKRPVKWSLSGGYDKESRKAAIQLAIDAGRITPSEAARIMPELEKPTDKLAIAGPSEPEVSPEIARERIRELISNISKPMPEAE